jgi:hypothetical protein
LPTYSHGSRILKGAIVAIDPNTRQPVTVAFQYNPETVRRSLQPQMAGGEQGQRSLAVRFTGAPVETIDLEVQIDAVDQMEAAGATNGIYPQLSLLELLAYPTSQQIIQNNALLASGTLEVAPMTAPLALFIWGPNRVLPVRLNQVGITEELFDPQLNPIRATVNLGLRALSYSDLDASTQGYNLFLAYQQTREAMARQAGTANPNSITGVSVNQL